MLKSKLPLSLSFFLIWVHLTPAWAEGEFHHPLEPQLRLADRPQLNHLKLNHGWFNRYEVAEFSFEDASEEHHSLFVSEAVEEISYAARTNWWPGLQLRYLMWQHQQVEDSVSGEAKAIRGYGLAEPLLTSVIRFPRAYQNEPTLEWSVAYSPYAGPRRIGSSTKPGSHRTGGRHIRTELSFILDEDNEQMIGRFFLHYLSHRTEVNSAMERTLRYDPYSTLGLSLSYQRPLFLPDWAIHIQGEGSKCSNYHVYSNRGDMKFSDGLRFTVALGLRHILANSPFVAEGEFRFTKSTYAIGAMNEDEEYESKGGELRLQLIHTL